MSSSLLRLLALLQQQQQLLLLLLISSSSSSVSLCFEVTNFRFSVTVHNLQYLYTLVLKCTAFITEWIGDGGTVDVSYILTTVSKAQISET
jgi:hypothetical protein